MGWVETRINQQGSIRYVAKYRDIRGRKQTAGTFGEEKPAKQAWQDAEAKVREGRGHVLVRGKQQFEPYVRGTWFPNHRLELRTRETYSYYLDKRIIPWFGKMAMREVLPSDVREFVVTLEKQGVKASSIAYCLTILNAIFTTALNDQIVYLHAGKGVRAPTAAKKLREIITPEQFDMLYDALRDKRWQLLVEVGIETGLRWGELTELRPRDFNFSAHLVTVSRVAVELVAKRNPEGRRFVIKEYPKDNEHRRVSLSPELAAKIKTYIAKRELGKDDLLFQMPSAPRPVLRVAPDPGKLGRTEPNAKGKTYKHGSMSGYSAGGCRCDDCRASYAIYRAGRRAEGKDEPRDIRVIHTDGHISRRWFRTSVWLPARDAAGLGPGVKVHSLRHAHASWLLAGGADISRVKDRLGHSSILTTQKYVHTLPDLAKEDSALSAFGKIRNRSKTTVTERKARGI